jgi:hypothetical protein
MPPAAERCRHEILTHLYAGDAAGGAFAFIALLALRADLETEPTKDEPFNLEAVTKACLQPKIEPEIAPLRVDTFLQKKIEELKKFKLSGRSVVDLLDLEIDPATNLLGDRWLPRDGSAFVIAPSGHGKSSMALQATILWSIGRVAFGIKPIRPLRILFLQSEDDDAESKKFVQLIRKLGLTPKEIELMRQNTRFEFRRDIAGQDFIDAVDDFLTEWPADIVIINPLSGFLLCDLKDDDKVNQFLRGDLNAVMAKHQCAPLIFHHTPKTNFTKLENMQWYDWMYAMSGCAGLTNWARAVLVIAPSKIPGAYRFIAAKRFDEIQWTEREYWYAHSKETFQTDDGKKHTIIQWVPATNAQIDSAKPVSKGRKPTASARLIWEKMSPVERYTRPTFVNWATEEPQFNVGVNKAWSILQTLCDQGLVQVSIEKRKGTNPRKWYQKISEPASNGNEP